MSDAADRLREMTTFPDGRRDSVARDYMAAALREGGNDIEAGRDEDNEWSGEYQLGYSRGLAAAVDHLRALADELEGKDE